MLFRCKRKYKKRLCNLKNSLQGPRLNLDLFYNLILNVAAQVAEKRVKKSVYTIMLCSFHKYGEIVDQSLFHY